MFIAHAYLAYPKLRWERNFSDASKGALKISSLSSYKHFAPNGAELGAKTYYKLRSADSIALAEPCLTLLQGRN